MVIYIDSDNKCYATSAEGLRAFETELINDFFKGKCAAFIEGYRYIPYGESWTRSDGKVFHGEAISPWKNSVVLMAYQEQYEAMLAELEAAKADLADADDALAELGVEWGEDNG